MEDQFHLATGNINSLIWADDIFLFSKTENGLTKMLKVLEDYCKKNKLTVNTKKTKCMIFNKTGRLIRRPFFFNGVELENVRAYKYLGFLITPSGEISRGLHDLRDRAFKAFMAIKSNLGVDFNKDVKTALSLVDAMVKPILLYLGDFWGCTNLPKSNPIENLHMMMCKQILGVQKQTTNIGVLLELGRVPLNLTAIKFAIKNWERIRKKQANDLLVASYIDATDENLPWISGIKNILEKHGLLSLFQNEYEDQPLFIYKKLYQRLVDSFHQISFESIKGVDSKLRTYAIFKTEIGYEKYLSDIKNPSNRKHLTKLRLSNHTLMIETGRHTKDKIKKEMRFCPFCPKSIETELHFLLECPLYNTGRNEILKQIHRLTPNFSHYTIEQKLVYLMSNIDTELVNYIANSFQIRTFILEKHKRCI